MRPVRHSAVKLFLWLVAAAPVAAAPVITGVRNAASNLDPRLPNSAIARGSIFVVYGSGLGPADISFAPAAFQSKSLSGTSVQVTVGGTVVDAWMYYTSATQVAALLPSNTPVGGAGTANPSVQPIVTVTYNGEASAPTPFQGVRNNALGMFTIDSTGTGPAIVTYPDYSLVSPSKAANCGGPYTTCGAANPGDTLTLWATGMGPVAGNEASGAGLGQNMPNIPLTVWLGGRQAPVVYQGRSGCCIGLDQIVFTVPDNVPTGCAVPLVVQIAGGVSNTTVLPVAIGSRSCTPADPALAALDVERLSNLSSFTLGVLKLRSMTGARDQAQFLFSRVSGIPAGWQPFLASFLDQPPIGTCNFVIGPLSATSDSAPRLPESSRIGTFIRSLNPASIDAGSTFTITGPGGVADTLTVKPEDVPSISRDGRPLVPGEYTIAGGPGRDVGAFWVRVTVPVSPTPISPASGDNLRIIQTQGMTVTWNPNGSTGQVELWVSRFLDPSTASEAICTAPASAGTFTIPPHVLLALPNGGGAFLELEPGYRGPASSAAFSAAGLDLGIVQTFIDSRESLGPFSVTRN